MLARLLYGALIALALPAVVLRLMWRGYRNPAYRLRRSERFGHTPAAVPKHAVWFHTVSAGETIAANPLIRHLKAEFPALPFLVTTMTPTGSDQVERLLNGTVAHCYAPYDFGFAVRRFLDRVQPRLLVLMETELWPNLIGMTADRGIRVVVINARLSARSARAYGRFGPLTRAMFSQLAWVACQYPDHAERFRSLGMAPERVEVLGNVKFDVELPADHAERVAAMHHEWALAQRPVWIAASTHPGEDELVLEAHRRITAAHPDVLLMLVPRHPDRFKRVELIAERHGFVVGRQSAGAQGSRQYQVLIGDSMGELVYLYGLARAAFVGGSLVPVGGHNPIEPALNAIPIVMGPHRFNFDDIVRRFTKAGCLHTVGSARELATVVCALLADREAALSKGRAARHVAADNRGATDRLAARLSAEICLALTGSSVTTD